MTFSYRELILTHEHDVHYNSKTVKDLKVDCWWTCVDMDGDKWYLDLHLTLNCFHDNGKINPSVTYQGNNTS